MGKLLISFQVLTSQLWNCISPLPLLFVTDPQNLYHPFPFRFTKYISQCQDLWTSANPLHGLKRSSIFIAINQVNTRLNKTFNRAVATLQYSQTTFTQSLNYITFVPLIVHGIFYEMLSKQKQLLISNLVFHILIHGNELVLQRMRHYRKESRQNFIFLNGAQRSLSSPIVLKLLEYTKK